MKWKYIKVMIPPTCTWCFLICVSVGLNLHCTNIYADLLKTSPACKATADTLPHVPADSRLKLWWPIKAYWRSVRRGLVGVTLAVSRGHEHGAVTVLALWAATETPLQGRWATGQEISWLASNTITGRSGAPHFTGNRSGIIRPSFHPLTHCYLCLKDVPSSTQAPVPLCPPLSPRRCATSPQALVQQQLGGGITRETQCPPTHTLAVGEAVKNNFAVYNPLLMKNVQNLGCAHCDFEMIK